MIYKPDLHSTPSFRLRTMFSIFVLGETPGESHLVQLPFSLFDRNHEELPSE